MGKARLAEEPFSKLVAVVKIQAAQHSSAEHPSFSLPHATLPAVASVPHQFTHCTTISHVAAFEETSWSQLLSI